MRSQVEDLGPLKRAKLRKILKETEHLERRIAKLDELYIDKAAARQEIASVIHNPATAFLAEARSSAEALDALGLLARGAKPRAAKLLSRAADGLAISVDVDESNLHEVFGVEKFTHTLLIPDGPFRRLSISAIPHGFFHIV